MSNKPKNILFRADSSSTIGTGHIMRDLVLAEQFKDANIIFATQNLSGNINHKIEEKDYTIEILNSNDIEELDALIKELGIDMIVIDHYGIDYDFEKQLKTQNAKLKIFSLDDTYEKHYCDILLNHNISADEKKYKDLVPKNCELRCGIKFTLLRDEFLNIDLIKKNNNFKKNFKVFIAMGGADSKSMNITILNEIKNLDLNVEIVTTKANENIIELKEYVKSFKNINLNVDSSDIASIIASCDIAIITPSVMVNEVIFFKIPFISILVTDNQLDMFNFLKRKGMSCLKSTEMQFLNTYIEELYNEENYNYQIEIITSIIHKRLFR